MFINNLEQCDWIKKRFETPGVSALTKEEKRRLMTRVLRSTRYAASQGHTRSHKVIQLGGSRTLHHKDQGLSVASVGRLNTDSCFGRM